MNLRGKTVVVTGASRGIGRALAFTLADRGCNLVLTALEAGELEDTAEAVRSAGTRVTAHPADLLDAEARQRLMTWLRIQPEPPDILVNNAGGGAFRRFESSDLAAVQRTIDLNARAPTALAHGMLPILRTRPEGLIVFISSAIARLPYPGLAVYGASKAYLSSLAESLSCELARSGIGVLCFHPGFTATEFMASAGMDMRRVPRPLVAKPEAVAERIARAIERDETWAYANWLTRLGAAAGRALPARTRTRVFRNLFWRLP